MKAMHTTAAVIGYAVVALVAWQLGEVGLAYRANRCAVKVR